MAYEFHYTPTGTGVISGKEVLEQTEDAINDLGNTAISGVQEALDKAEQALTNSANAVDDAQTALNTANNAEGVAIQAQTDVGNLSGTVTNIGNRVTTAEGNISNLQGRMTTAEGNITNLQGRMTTAENNIGNLQTAVSTAQATANSAQQTATTARQQSYVFRYSGTAVVPNSTIAYSTIDNTDNIKSGDKILDVDGKLFEITAVDTTNQTVTVGTALIDLALDANVVHTSGNETISGDKVFNNRLIKNIDVVLGTAPSTGKFSIIDIADNNKASLLQILGGVYDTGQSYARFFVQNKTADDGTGLSPTGTIRACGFNINLPASSTSEGQGSITPRANKTTDFGLSSYQWRNLWCEKLFLNGTQLDPSAFALDANVVHTSGDETINGVKSFINYFLGKDLSGQTVDLNDCVDAYGGAIHYYYAVSNYTNISNKPENKPFILESKTVRYVSSIDYIYYQKIYTAEYNASPSIYTRYYRSGSASWSNWQKDTDKFVTTDTTQTISGAKTFSSNVNVYNSDTSASTPNITLRSSKSAMGTSDTDSQGIFLNDKNNDTLASLKILNYTLNGSTYLTQTVNTKDTNNQNISASLSFYILNNGRKVFRPDIDNDVLLGYSSNKWKDCQTYQINGLTPSSLGMPSNTGYVDITGYFTNTGDGQTNSYTASANGWIYLNVVATRLIMQIRDSNDNNIYADMRVRSSDGTIYMTIPIGSGNKLLTQWFTSSSVTVTTARFIPCQGNI